jgi:hypothetical protein
VCLRPQRGLPSASSKFLTNCYLREAASAACESRVFHCPAPCLKKAKVETTTYILRKGVVILPGGRVPIRPAHLDLEVLGSIIGDAAEL